MTALIRTGLRRRPDSVLGAFIALDDPLTIELPWFNAALAPNRANGRAWGGLATTKSNAKANAYALTKNAAKGRKLSALEKYPLCITFIAPDNRRYTKKQLGYIEEFKQKMGMAYPHYWSETSARDIAQAGVDAVAKGGDA